MTGIAILAVAVVAALAFGAFRSSTDGRFKRERRVLAPRDRDLGGPRSVFRAEWAAISAAIPGADLGERATFVQFSSSFCAPCRTTRALLADIAARADGVSHLEIDAEQHLDLVRALDVRRTPTTLVLDATGVEVARAAGAPRRDQVLSAIPAGAR